MARSRFHVRMAIYLGLGSLQAAFSLILMPAYAHILTVSEFGLLALLLSLEQLFLVIMDLGMSSGAVRTYHAKRDETLAFLNGPALFLLYQRLALKLSCLAFGAIAVALIVMDAAFPQTVSVALAFALTLVSSWFQRINNSFASAYRAQEEAGRFAQLALARIIGLTTVTFGILMFLEVGIVGLIISRILVFGATALFEMHTMAKPSLTAEQLQKGRAYVRDCARRLAGSLLPIDLLGWGKGRGNRVALASVLSFAGLGVFNAAAAPGQVLTIVGLAFNRAFEPLVYKRVKEGSAEAIDLVRDMGSAFLASQAVIALAVSAIASEVYRLAFPEPYHIAAVYTPLALASAFVASSEAISVRALMAHGHLAILPKVQVAATVSGLGLMMALAYLFGLTGAMFGMLAMSAIGSTGMWLAARSGFGATHFPLGFTLFLMAIVIAFSCVPLFLSEAWVNSDSLSWRLLLATVACSSIGIGFCLTHKPFVRMLIREFRR